MKFNKEKMKQIMLTCIAFSLILLGYFNYSLDNLENNDLEVSAEVNEVNIGDVELVSSETFESSIVSNEGLEEHLIENQNIEKTENTKNEELKTKDNYFEETKLQRDRMYSEMLETYQKLINSQETPEDQKAIAVQEIANITKAKNGIMIAENLIKNKGFENVVILINNETISVVVKSTTLNQEQISKIQNIVQRELQAKIDNISITNKQ